MSVVFVFLELLISSVAQNLVTTHATDFSPLGTGTITSLTPFEVDCQIFGGLLKRYVLTRPTDTTLQYNYDCIQAPPSQYLINKETILNNCYDGSIIYLNRHDVNCEGGLISNFQLIYVSSGPYVKYLHSCSNYGTLRCYSGVTNEKDAPKIAQNVIYLDRYNDLECNEGYALSSFVYSAYSVGDWNNDSDYRNVWRGKYSFTCCRISSLTMLPSTTPTVSPSSSLTVLPTTYPTTISPSVLPTTTNPSTASPSSHPTTNSPSSVSPSSHPTTDIPSNQPTFTPPTHQPTQPISLIFHAVTVGGFIAIVGFFLLLIIACTFTLCFKYLSRSPERENKPTALPQDEVTEENA